MPLPAVRIPAPEAFAPVGDALAALGIGVTLVDREMRIRYANAFVRDAVSELSCGGDHCFAALWRKDQRCPDCLPLLVFRTGEAHEGVRERGRPGAPAEAWRVRAIPVLDPSGAVAWVAESFLRLSTLAPDLAGRAPAPEGGAASIVVDREERIVSWSPAAAAMFGHRVEQALGRRIDLIVPEDRLDEERGIAARVAAEGQVPRLETIRRTRDGRRVPVAITAAAVRDEVGALVGRAVTLDDLSALQDLRGRVQAQEQLLAHIGREAADAIVGVDLAGTVTSWNRAAEQLLGVTAGEMVGRSLSRVAPPEVVAKLLERVRERQAVRGVRMAWRGARAEDVPVEISAALLGDGAAGVAIVARDLSAQARLDRQLVRSEKLAMVGSLAAGLAHEIGTPLAVISATAEYLLLDARDEARRQLGGIVAETERISRLVRELLSFARGTQPGKAPVALDDAVEKVLSLLRFTLEKRRLRVEVDVPAELPRVLADPDGLHQVLLNLIVNAAQAVDEGGTVGVRARPADAERVDEPSVAIEVHDDGPGVAPGLRERIFDPFYTTRPDGTGLGLAVCARIVAEHGGDLRVGAGQLGGASFTVQLPAAEEDA
jgi:PAS domain S-box-containing protein